MGDLNLIPQEIKLEAEQKVKRKKLILISIIAVIVVAIVTSAPYIYIYNINNEIKSIEADINKYSYVTDEVNKVNQLKNSIQQRSKLLDTLAVQEKKWTNIINKLSSMMPKDITASILNGSNENISLQCSALSQQDIAVFIANLENSKLFTDIKLNEIIFDDKNKRFVFSLILTPQTTESKVK